MVYCSSWTIFNPFALLFLPRSLIISLNVHSQKPISQITTSLRQMQIHDAHVLTVIRLNLWAMSRASITVDCVAVYKKLAHCVGQLNQDCQHPNVITLDIKLCCKSYQKFHVAINDLTAGFGAERKTCCTLKNKKFFVSIDDSIKNFSPKVLKMVVLRHHCKPPFETCIFKSVAGERKRQ